MQVQIKWTGETPPQCPISSSETDSTLLLCFAAALSTLKTSPNRGWAMSLLCTSLYVPLLLSTPLFCCIFTALSAAVKGAAVMRLIHKESAIDIVYNEQCNNWTMYTFCNWHISVPSQSKSSSPHHDISIPRVEYNVGTFLKISFIHSFMCRFKGNTR